MTHTPPIRTIVVGYGLAGRVFHVPLIRRQPRLQLAGLVIRNPDARQAASNALNVPGLASLDDALSDPTVDLIVLATPHDTHESLSVRTLEAGKACVVDKVMALSEPECDRMIAARDSTGQMLSVFHNRRWDWDFATLKHTLHSGALGQPLLIESSVCRYAVPRTWRGDLAAAGTILHDWGAHLVDQALGLGLGPCRRLTAWIIPAPWPGVSSGGHGRILMEFDSTLVQVETSRVCRLDRPRFWAIGTDGGFAKFGLDPQEDALRASGRLEDAAEAPDLRAILRTSGTAPGQVVESHLPTVHASWDAFYANIADHLLDGVPLAVTAEQAREVVRILAAAVTSSDEHRTISAPTPVGWSSWA
jgi:scyllo-inositol 2-dehydrogenase (NADP+)